MSESMRKVRLTGRQMQVLQEMKQRPQFSSTRTRHTFLRLHERGLIEYVDWIGWAITEAGRGAIAPKRAPGAQSRTARARIHGSLGANHMFPIRSKS